MRRWPETALPCKRPGELEKKPSPLTSEGSRPPPKKELCCNKKGRQVLEIPPPKPQAQARGRKREWWQRGHRKRKNKRMEGQRKRLSAEHTARTEGFCP
uniref:Uncharacterized protein n=1 Tax=Cyanistes caeruleus TaxID=156563 RepID=A0A8C0U9S9_CYACU